MLFFFSKVAFFSTLILFPFFTHGSSQTPDWKFPIAFEDATGAKDEGNITGCPLALYLNNGFNNLTPGIGGSGKVISGRVRNNYQETLKALT